MLSPIFSSSII